MNPCKVQGLYLLCSVYFYELGHWNLEVVTPLSHIHLFTSRAQNPLNCGPMVDASGELWTDGRCFGWIMNRRSMLRVNCGPMVDASGELWTDGRCFGWIVDRWSMLRVNCEQMVDASGELYTNKVPILKSSQNLKIWLGQPQPIWAYEAAKGT